MLEHLYSKPLSSEELVRAHLKQIEAVNPRVNAVVTLVAKQALEKARYADTLMAKSESLVILHGLPVFYKDLQETKGILRQLGNTVSVLK